MIEEKLLEIRKKVALACRILYMEGLGDLNLGHISSRVPGQDNIYIKHRGLGLEEVNVDDVIMLDLEGKQIEGKHPPHGETPIHTEIYKARGDVQSVVHLHPLITTAFSTIRGEIMPLSQDGVVFAEGVPTILSPELITTKQQAKSLVEKLGNSNAILMLNHGIVTVGKSIEEACMNAIFLEKTLKLQLIASLFGKIESIPREIALKMCNEFVQKPERTESMWDYLVRKLKRKGLGLE